VILFYLVLLISTVPNLPLFSVTIGPLSIAKYLGLVALLYAALHLAVRRTIPAFLESWPARFFLLLVTMAALSTSLRGEGYIDFSPLEMYITFLGIFFITLALVDSKAKLRYALLAVVGSIGLASAYTLREYEKVGLPWYRPGWVAGDSNAFATNCLLVIPVAILLLRTRLSRWQKLFCIGCLLLTLPAFTVAASRGAFLGLCVMLLYLFFRAKRRSGLVLLAVVLGLLTAYSPTSAVDRFMAPRYGDTESVQIHFLLWRAGFRMIEDHPIAGIGLGRFKPDVSAYAPPGLDVEAMAHNVYIEYAAELGVAALFLYLAILISSWVALERVRRKAWKSDNRFFFSAASGIQAGLVGFAVAANFMPAEYLKPFWILVFLSACLPRLYAAEECAQPLRTTTAYAHTVLPECAFPAGDALTEYPLLGPGPDSRAWHRL
jgi:putative inorganic carbon (HCO3(-)) transporter